MLPAGLIGGGLSLIGGLANRFGNNAQEYGTQMGKLERAKHDAYMQFRQQQIASRGYRTPFTNRALFESKMAGFDDQAEAIKDQRDDASWLAPMAGAATQGINQAADLEDKESRAEYDPSQPYGSRFASMYGRYR